MIRTLSLDLETRSSVDLAKCGVYRYCESTDFDYRKKSLLRYLMTV